MAVAASKSKYSAPVGNKFSRHKTFLYFGPTFYKGFQAFPELSGVSHQI